MVFACIFWSLFLFTFLLEMDWQIRSNNCFSGDMNERRDQSYDGASAMREEFTGVQALVQKGYLKLVVLPVYLCLNDSLPKWSLSAFVSLSFSKCALSSEYLQK